MSNKISRFFTKYNITIDSIKYILSESPFTSFYFKDSREKLSISNLKLKEVHSFLPETQFLNIQKGIIVSFDYIADITDKGVYTMKDGNAFQGRQRYLKEHKQNRARLIAEQTTTFPLDAVQSNSKFSMSHANPAFTTPFLPLKSDHISEYAILDKLPLAFCLIELVFDENGRGMDFIFRYCNKEMAHLEGCPIEDMINHSFYEVFKNGDKKWLVTYADVALNGVSKVIHDYSPEVDKYLSIYCYQPYEGYCACALIPSS